MEGKQMTDLPTKKMKRRLTRNVVVLIVAVIAYIVYVIFRVSVIEAKKWQDLANSQQVKSTVTQASRGTIYDTNGQVLAQSATVYRVYCDPVMLWGDYLDKRDERIKELNELIADEKDPEKRAEYQEKLDGTKSTQDTYDDLVTFLSDKLDVETDVVRTACTKKESQYETIKQNVDKTVAAEIEAYLSDEGLDGIRCEPSTKRFYPQGDLASTVVGHLDYDGNGIYGLEAYYDDYLRGTNGRVITATDRDGKSIPYRYKQSYDAQDGSSLVLNIDANIQYQLEKALEKAYEKSTPVDRVCGIIMNPNTGAVYAMATKYAYDNNSPAEITNESVAAQLAALDPGSDEYHEIELNEWSRQWRNKAVSDLYNPGSVFKVITGASALEDNAITLDDTFTCNTQIVVADTPISCWSFVNHGSQNLAAAMTNSCNPVFVQISQRMGVQRFMKYFRAFGFTEKTGIDLPGEADPFYFDVDNMSIVDLAVSSFGQGNKITPIQMITAYSAAINGGYLVTPQVVDKIVDPNGNVVKDFDTVVKRQVISEEVSAEIRAILENVCTSSPSGNCLIKGYRIGGKSGTSQKMDEDVTGNTYVASYCAFAPADDPQVVMLIVIDHPLGAEYYGSQLAAPVCTEIFTEILPYMGYFPQYTDEELAEMQVNVSNVEYSSVTDAEKTLKDLGLNVEVKGTGTTVYKQVPSLVTVERGSTVVLYTDENYTEETTTVPNIQGLSREKAKEVLAAAGLNLSSQGSAIDEEDSIASDDQSFPAQSTAPVGSAVSVTFQSQSVGSW